MYKEHQNYRPCDACGYHFDTEHEWNNRCTPHEPGCPFGDDCSDENFDLDEYTDLESCDCDLNYHPECCPKCNPSAQNAPKTVDNSL